MVNRHEWQIPKEDLLVERPVELVRELTFSEEELIDISTYIEGCHVYAKAIPDFLKAAAEIKRAKLLLNRPKSDRLQSFIDSYTDWQLPEVKGIYFRAPKYIRENMRTKFELREVSSGNARGVIVPGMPTNSIFVVDYWRTHSTEDPDFPEYNEDEQYLSDSAIGYILHSDLPSYRSYPVAFKSENKGYAKKEILKRVVEELQLQPRN